MLDVKTREELERELNTAEDELDEVEDMRMAILGQTGVHIGARELEKHYDRFDSDQKRLTGRIAEIKARLAALATNH